MLKSVKVPVIKEKSISEINLPKYATEHSAGMDILSNITESVVIKHGEVAIIPTGLKIAIPDGYEVQIRPRSGLAAKNGVTVLNSPGTIDSDYRGEIKVILINHGKEDFIVEPNMRIAQMVFAKYECIQWELVDNLEETTRGSGGFGSTGVK